METSLPESVSELKAFVRYLDKTILAKAIEWARQCYRDILERLDDILAEHRDRELVIEHRRAAWYQTCAGAVSIRRRQYRDEAGKRRCLLDELLGMGKYQHCTASLKETALELATQMPYRRAADVLRKASAIDLPHQTIWRLVAQAAKPHIEQGEQKLKRFLETGEASQGEGRKAAYLLMEADGVILSLQREKERRAEVKLGIAYEGWARVGKNRYKTVNKMAYAAVGSEDAFWAGMTLKLQERYDLSGIEHTVVGGDGARWIKNGAGYMNGRFQLDRYHLNRELCLALGRDKDTRSKVWQACEWGDVRTGLKLLDEAARKATGAQAKRLAKACQYLADNSSGLGDYRPVLGEAGRGLRRTGAIEGNIDKLIVRRMKNQGMSWTIAGIRRLLCVRFLVLEGKLAASLDRRGSQESPVTVPRRKLRRLVTQLSFQEPDQWLTAHLPALDGPHACRPWVKSLKALSEVSSL